MFWTRSGNTIFHRIVHVCISTGAVAFILLVLAPMFSIPWALSPNEVLVVANKNLLQSVKLAKYYMERRGIPESNLITLWLSTNERCSRKEYEDKAMRPIRALLKERDTQSSIFRCMAIMYGIPLVVSPPEQTSEEKAKQAKLEERVRELRSNMEKISEEQARKTNTQETEQTQKEISALAKADQESAFDSEIALVREESYPLANWIPNPYFLGFKGKSMKDMPSSVLIVSRLDGPTEKIVRRIIDDSIATEAKGLQGKAYFDARWPDPGKKDLSGYAFYDMSLHQAAKLVSDSKLMPVVLDEKERLFQPGECPEAALYCGWYSLANYVGAFTWVPGSIGFHIASQECQTLKQSGSRTWCKVMLEKGIAATVGPVGEPYVQTFPVPALFFGTLLQGNFTLAESYALSVPFWSWKMVLVGDPLYRPFKNRIR